jgi:hypothetical protein
MIEKIDDIDCIRDYWKTEESEALYEARMERKDDRNERDGW